MMKFGHLMILAMAFVAASIDTNPIHTVSFFVKYPEARRYALAQCNERPGIKDPNCAAATAAEFNAQVAAFSKATWK